MLHGILPSSTFCVNNSQTIHITIIFHWTDTKIIKRFRTPLQSVYGRADSTAQRHAYMDPKSIIDGSVGPFTDVFALGVTLLQLLTGASNPVGVWKDVGDAVQSIDVIQDEGSRIAHVIDPSLKSKNAEVRQVFFDVLPISLSLNTDIIFCVCAPSSHPTVPNCGFVQNIKHFYVVLFRHCSAALCLTVVISI